MVATDAHGRPALLRRAVGAGRLVRCCYPREHTAAVPPRVNPEPTWRLYAGLAALAGVTPEVTVDDPRALVGRMAHRGGRGFGWFVSQHPAPLTARPVVRGGLLVVGWDGERLADVDLPPYGVLVAERTR